MRAKKLIRRDFLVGAAISVGALTISVKVGSAAEPKTHEVAIRSFKFEPQHLQVEIGDIISWKNEDLAPHTATASDGSWDTGELAKGDSQSIEVVKGMEISYFCAFHPHMKGTIVLK
ncbi:MAG: cupredoxin domain-containing protein [Pseudomonadota bacterium]